jgi:uncharacterized membrane protein
MKSDVYRSYKNIYLLSVTTTGLMFILSAYAWLQIPANAGDRDESAWKFMLIFAIPILTTAILILIPVFARGEARQRHIVQSQKALTTIWAALLILFSVIQIVLLLSYLGRTPNLATYWPILAGLAIIVVGNYLGKISSNTVAGFRTPWTLSSELSWNKTHRLGGKLLFLIGLILIAGSIIITGDSWVYFLLVSCLLWVVVLTVYSYFVWKKDPDSTHENPSLTA